MTGSGHQEIKPHPGSGRKAVLFKATLVLTPFLVVVLAAEGCLRLSAARVQQKNREVWQRSMPIGTNSSPACSNFRSCCAPANIPASSIGSDPVLTPFWSRPGQHGREWVP